MIYPAHFETKIGFDRIRTQTAALCSTARARQMTADETFCDAADEVARRLDLTDELRTILLMESDFPRDDFDDPGPLLRKLPIAGAFLEVEELVLLRRALGAIGTLTAFFASRAEGSYPALRSLAEGIDAYPSIASHIDTLVDRWGNVRDNASPGLYEVRRRIRERESQVAKRLHEILARAREAGWTDPDASVSIREGRGVIPVQAVHKRRIDGLVHDESASGKTFYIEPVEVVQLNNELRELTYAERREIVTLLTAFTESIRPDLEGLVQAGEWLCTLDFLRAKARLALDMGAVRPILSVEGRLELRRARHPLLEQTLRREGKSVVPLDLRLEPAERMLLISGPNAGGKSVCLKTTGLLQYMLQCGWLVPALENSELPLFRNLFIDIGDEQSIDNDLSTYSSHLVNMKHTLAGADERSLVLIDEFGSGTEPTIGGAIAEAILARLVARGCYGVVTTHYANLKYFAANTAGIANGAMLFDVAHIAPLFRLEQGIPGSSFAVEIARKIGLPEEIIREAGEKAGSDYMNLERQLREIARDRRYWEQKRERIRTADRRVEQLEAEYAERLRQIREERRTVLAEARAEAERLVGEANRRIENTIRTIRESQADKELTRLARREVNDFRTTLTEADAAAQADREARIDREMARIEVRRRRRAERKSRRGETPESAEAEPEKLPLTMGSKVRIAGQDTPGEITALRGGKATVAFGQLLTTLDVSRLEAISEGQYKRLTRPATPRTVIDTAIGERRLAFSGQIDVRGQRVAEALENVRDWLDDAIMVGAEQVRILHGKGTGALKEELRAWLRTVPEVASAADEHEQMGGAGITVVRLRS